jgi:hypothetical protein
MRKYLASGIAAALLACLTAVPASANPYGTFIANSGNGAGNTIAVTNGGPTRILGSGNGANNTIAVQNLGCLPNPTVIRNSANGMANTIVVSHR